MGAIVNVALQTVLHFSAFWVTVCAEINVLFSQGLRVCVTLPHREAGEAREAGEG